MMGRALLAVAFVFSFGLGLNAHAQTTKESKSEAAARLHAELGARYHRVGQVAVAVDELKLALDARSDYVPALTLLGLIEAQLHQNEQADAHFTQALAAAQNQKINDTDIRNSYAWFLCGSDRGEQALAEFATVFRDPVYPSMGKALTNAGVCAARLGRDDLALAYLNATLDRDANNAVALIYRGHVFVNARQYANARNDWRAAQKLQNDEPTIAWLEIRLAQAERQRMTARDTLIRDYPTSLEAEWARSAQYNKV